MTTYRNGSMPFNQTRGGCNNVDKSKFQAMGYTMRTPVFRYTLWLRWIGNGTNALQPEWDGDFVEELYDHVNDNSTSMDNWENVNLAATAKGRAAIDGDGGLRAQLEKFFRSD